MSTGCMCKDHAIMKAILITDHLDWGKWLKFESGDCLLFNGGGQLSLDPRYHRVQESEDCLERTMKIKFKQNVSKAT